MDRLDGGSKFSRNAQPFSAMVSIGKCLMMTLLLATCAAEDKAVAKEMPEKPDSVEKAGSSGNECLDLCWRRGSQCWYWHYSGLAEEYPESKCDSIFSTCSGDCLKKLLGAKSQDPISNAPLRR